MIYIVTNPGAPAIILTTYDPRLSREPMPAGTNVNEWDDEKSSFMCISLDMEAEDERD